MISFVAFRTLAGDEAAERSLSKGRGRSRLAFLFAGRFWTSANMFSRSMFLLCLRSPSFPLSFFLSFFLSFCLSTTTEMKQTQSNLKKGDGAVERFHGRSGARHRLRPPPVHACPSQNRRHIGTPLRIGCPEQLHGRGHRVHYRRPRRRKCRGCFVIWKCDVE